METKEYDSSFKAWLLSTHKKVEKTAGAVVLAIEMIAILRQIFHGVPELLLTKLLNLMFLIFIYIQLRGEFARQFTVNPDDADVARILRVRRHGNYQKQIIELVHSANTLIAQLKNVNYFIIITAGLYVLLLLQKAASSIFSNETVTFVLSIVHLSSAQAKDLNDSGFHILIDLFSYGGAFFLLRCFLVMYERTVDEYGDEILVKKTNIYVLIGAFLMIFDVCTTIYAEKPYGIFVAEFICGVVNAVVLILFIARFENKILDIPPFVLCLLYVYAILQTCLPFVTNNELGLTENFSVGFSSIVLKLCLVGKVALSAVLLYVLNSGRIFYYFMTLRKIHKEEEEHWEEFTKLIEPFQIKPDNFRIVYGYDKVTKSYSATITGGLFEESIGKGSSRDNAKDELLQRIKSGEKSSPP